MGKSLVDTRAVTRNKMRCPRSRTEKSYLSEKEWAELSEMVEILICPNIATLKKWCLLCIGNGNCKLMA